MKSKRMLITAVSNLIGPNKIQEMKDGVLKLRSDSPRSESNRSFKLNGMNCCLKHNYVWLTESSCRYLYWKGKQCTYGAFKYIDAHDLRLKMRDKPYGSQLKKQYLKKVGKRYIVNGHVFSVSAIFSGRQGPLPITQICSPEEALAIWGHHVPNWEVLSKPISEKPFTASGRKFVIRKDMVKDKSFAVEVIIAGKPHYAHCFCDECGKNWQAPFSETLDEEIFFKKFKSEEAALASMTV